MTELLFVAMVVAIVFLFRRSLKFQRVATESVDRILTLNVRLAAMNEIAILMHKEMSPAQRLSVEFNAGPAATLPWVRAQRGTSVGGAS